MLSWFRAWYAFYQYYWTDCGLDCIACYFCLCNSTPQERDACLLWYSLYTVKGHGAQVEVKTVGQCELYRGITKQQTCGSGFCWWRELLGCSFGSQLHHYSFVTAALISVFCGTCCKTKLVWRPFCCNDISEWQEIASLFFVWLFKNPSLLVIVPTLHVLVRSDIYDVLFPMPSQVSWVFRDASICRPNTDPS